MLFRSYETGDTIRIDYVEGEVKFERIIGSVSESAEPALTP